MEVENFEPSGRVGELVVPTLSEPTEGATRGRAKSSLRLKYEAEAQVIERKLGSLDSIRQQLGLSQRKIAQLLLVDPSAWTRWTKGDDQAPPHIYRMLQWYLALEEKYPALDVNFWLNTVSQVTERERVSSMAEVSLAQTKSSVAVLEAKLVQQSADLLNRDQALKRWILMAVVGSSLIGLMVGFLVRLATH